MPTIPLHVSVSTGRNGYSTEISTNPLPQLLQTPSGLAILELQGTINLPANDNREVLEQDTSEISQPTPKTETQIGRIIFADYNPSAEPSDQSWMKRVYLTVGQHQRLTGEVKKLSKPFAVIQRRKHDPQGTRNVAQDVGKNKDLPSASTPTPTDQLEIVEIIRYKILFSSRPEPITNEDY
ncbi:uncharacterized protein GIQ15_04090 [Arthroderma uncinatum]|uniref:uncharacterized protein n=1 Tax=Arthroderma uncinatum TaxID=74035 RepID=UPI00144AC7AA|nr:uncharacterized protein GIQ15_04090 [Arthroderma uncinatum]KAF3481331.1 hypothetical protein GIQ15_04090 [Arthroderma uncinatum]